LYIFLLLIISLRQRIVPQKQTQNQRSSITNQRIERVVKQQYKRIFFVFILLNDIRLLLSLLGLIIFNYYYTYINHFFIIISL